MILKRVVRVVTGNYIYFCKSKGLSDINITPRTTSDYRLNPQVSYFGTKTKIKFNGNCLKQDKLTYTHGKTVNIYIAYELTASSSNDKDPTQRNSLFGAVIDKYGYSGYRIGFDRRGSFSFPGSGFGSNALIFGVDMSSSVHVDNKKKKNILILGKGPTQGLEHTLTAEKMYSLNFTKANTKFCLSLHYNGGNSFLFVNVTDIYKFKAKDSEILATPLNLGNISKDWSVDNMKKIGFNGYVYDFSVHYDAIAVNDILDIHKYSMKKNNMI